MTYLGPILFSIAIKVKFPLSIAPGKPNKPISIGLLGNAADIYPKFIENNIIPDIVTDQTSAHDELNGYIPHHISFNDAIKLRKTSPKEYIEESYKSMAVHCQAMLDMQKKGSEVFDYGNNLRGQAEQNGGIKNAFDTCQTFFACLFIALIKYGLA